MTLHEISGKVNLGQETDDQILGMVYRTRQRKTSD